MRSLYWTFGLSWGAFLAFYLLGGRVDSPFYVPLAFSICGFQAWWPLLRPQGGAALTPHPKAQPPLAFRLAFPRGL